jgi:hypothetical protein
LFSNINKGIPRGYCYEIAKDFFFGYSMAIGISTLIGAFFLLIVLIFNICLCLHPERRNRIGYEKFNQG